MAKKRGLSADEKKLKMLAAMLEGKTVYSMKELEKVGKEQGISGMIIKDVVQEMLDDDMIIQERVGTNTLYWIFPSQSYVLKKRKIESFSAQIATLEKEKAQLDKNVAKARMSHPESTERFEMLKQYEETKQKHQQLTEELDGLKERDPETIKKMKCMIVQAVDGANRWTDNLWTLKSYLIKKHGMSSKDADNALELPEDFDSVELPAFMK